MSAHLIIFAVTKHKTRIIVGKSTHFFGQPVYGQLIKSLDRAKITEMSRKNGGETSDSRRNGCEGWIKQLRIIDSTTVSLFSNAIFKGVGRHPKTGKKKGGIKVHSVIHANEGVPCDVQFTSAATNDSFMLAPSNYQHGEIVAMDRAYIDYAKFEDLTERNVVYVTKLKKNLVYEILADCMDMNADGKMEDREQVVVFRKDGINHIARIITYVDIKKGWTPKLISLLTNDFDMPMETIVDIYRRRWQIESLFKQIKQNFPLRYFYGESANAIKIQIWVTLIANLLLSLLQSSLERNWGFSGLATMVRIVLMYYLNMQTFFNQPDADLKIMLPEASEEAPPGNTSIEQGGLS